MSTYVVSGSASGIGAAIAERLRGDGHTVVGVDLRGAEVIGDLATASGRATAIASIRELTNRVDGVVPCAGIAGQTGTDGRLLISLNFFGAVALVTDLRPLMSPGGATVMVSSNSVTAVPGWDTDLVRACLDDDEERARMLASSIEPVMLYPASKAAVAWWVRRECVAWAKDGLRLNAVAPGLIATPMTDRLREDPNLGGFIDAFPNALERPGRPEEVAATVAFLLSEQASHVVGSLLYVDGGTDALLYPERPQPA